MLKAVKMIWVCMLFSIPLWAAGGSCPASSAYTEPVFGNSTESLSTMGVTSCYYIDFVGGTDTNAGTTEAAPWQHAPGMTGCASNCSTAVIAAGTGFIFKGGVVWSSAAMPWNFGKSGSSGSPNYIGYDPSWFANVSGTVNTSGTSVTWVSGVHSGNVCTASGNRCAGTPTKVGDFVSGLAGQTITINGTGFTVASVQSSTALTLQSSAGTQTGVSFSFGLWTRPIISGSAATSDILDMSATFVNIDDLEFADMFNNTACCTATVRDFWIPTSGNRDVHLYNSYFHGANVLSDGAHNSHFISWPTAGNDNTSTTHHNVLDNSDFCTPSTPTTAGNQPICSMTAQEGGPRQIFMNYFGSMGGSLLVTDNPIDFHNNVLEWQALSPDNGTDHENMYESNGETGSGMVMYNNVVRHGWNAGVVDFQMGPNSVTSYAFDNVLVDMDGGNMEQMYEGNNWASNVTYWFNNTVEGGPESSIGFNANSNPPSGVCGRSSGSLNTANWINMHCITTNNAGTNWIAPKAGTNNFTTNLAQSQATANAQGYSSGSASSFAPTLGTGGTVAAGTNESSLCTTIGSGATTNSTVNTNAQSACQQDTSYGVAYDKVSHAIVGAGRTSVARPSSAAWDVGAYQFSSASVPSVPSRSIMVSKADPLPPAEPKGLR